MSRRTIDASYTYTGVPWRRAISAMRGSIASASPARWVEAVPVVGHAQRDLPLPFDQ